MKKSVISMFDGTEVYYDKHYVESEYASLVFMHGWCCNRSFWNNQIDEFKKEYNILNIDIAGHGMSITGSRSEWSLEAISIDILSVLEKEKFEKVIFVGHSMADNIMLGLLNLYKGKILGIIGIDNFKEVVEPLTEEIYGNIVQFFNQDYEAALEHTVKSWVVSPEQNEELVHYIFNEMKKTSKDVSFKLGEISLTVDASSIITSTDVPLRIIACSPWSNENAEKLKAIFSDVHIYDMVPKSGHFPMLETKEEFNKILLTTIIDLH